MVSVVAKASIREGSGLRLHEIKLAVFREVVHVVGQRRRFKFLLLMRGLQMRGPVVNYGLMVSTELPRVNKSSVCCSLHLLCFIIRFMVLGSQNRAANKVAALAHGLCRLDRCWDGVSV